MSGVLEEAGVPVWLIGRVLRSHLAQRSELELLLFWGRWPYGWFGKTAITPLSTMAGAELDRALLRLIEAGIVRSKEENGKSYYGLADDSRVRVAVSTLARLTPNERRYLLRRIGPKDPPPRVSDAGSSAAAGEAAQRSQTE